MIRSFVVIALCCLVFSDCTPAYMRYLPNYTFKNDGQPDYASLDYWAAHPDKRDPSDSIPAPMKNLNTFDSTTDVFFIHPTTFTDVADARWNADVNEAAINVRTDYSTILFQASAFNFVRVFAPRYRQANLRAYFTKDSSRAAEAFNLAYADVRAAFQYYLDHFNQGHPIIIAAHSQGSTHAIKLLSEFFDGKPLAQKLVVAYVIGMNIPLHAFNQLKPCADSIQTGCFCAWRTFKRGHEPGLIKPYDESYVTNPLTWTTTENYAGPDLNKGGVLKNFNKVYRRVTDAEIHNSILWASRPKFPGSFLYRANNYHIGDINLYYLNIRENVQRRIWEFRSMEVHSP